MNQEKLLCSLIENESKKLIARYHEYHNYIHQENKRSSKRLGKKVLKEIHSPEYWQIDKKFNPFYCKQHSKAIAKSINKKIINKSYAPNTPYVKEIPKKPTGTRKISIYQIHDAAVSKLYYIRLLSKNKHRFSAFSYAYRNDRNVHFAIQDIWVDICNSSRMFIAEFDFSDFFGSISHDYLKKQLHKNGFLISEQDKFVIDAFLKDRNVGIPQGTSISLFLANLVCWNLDKKLEKEGLKFARYADDTVIWSNDYSKICKAFDFIHDFSIEAGVKINFSKSDGISLLLRDGMPSELSNKKTSIDFLGYSIHVDKISIKKNSVDKIKKQISYILYRNLIQPLRKAVLTYITVPNELKDENFLTAIMQIRRYLYGGLTDDILRDYLLGQRKRILFKGVMSFYPLVNDEKQLKELDGWMTNVILRTIKLRARLFKRHGHNIDGFFPFNTNASSIISECAAKRIYGKALLKIPSFILIYKALKKNILEHGIENTMNSKSNQYSYVNS